jgi:uroporphyrinogen-III synthase
MGPAPGPESGRAPRVLVTRPREQAEPLVEELRRRGLDVEVCPLIEIEPIDDGPIDVAGYDWVVVTSANGARELARRRGGDLPRVAAIGPGTAEALEQAGIEVELVPAVSTQEGLVAEFPRPAGRVLFVGAEEARRVLVDELGADFRPVYRTRRLRPDPLPAADLAVVASPSAAEALAALELGLPVVAIGPVTADAARTHGLDVVAEAHTQDVAGLVEAVLAAAAAR